MTVKEKHALKGEYTMAGKWTEYSDEQLLEMLKKTIEDMGMTKYPSRTELQKHIGDYDIPTAVTYMNKFDCTWQELMGKIGYEYDLDELYSEYGKRNRNKASGKKENVKWRDEPREKIIDVAIEEMRDKNIMTFADYQAKRDREKTPSVATISRKNIKWSEIKNEYKARYG